MKKIGFLILFLIIFTTLAIAQNYYSNTDDWTKAQKAKNGDITQVGEVSPGMETLEVSPGYSIIVPKGTKLMRSGSELVPERITQYSARRFEEIDRRFKGMEDDISGLKGEIEQLKASIKELTQRIKNQ